MHSLVAQKNWVTLPEPDLAALRLADEKRPRNLFAAPLPLDISPANAGSWVNNNGVNGRWECHFHLASTAGLALYFDQLQLPAGGQLFLRNAQGQQGPFTQANVSEHGLLFTGFLPGNTVTLVYEGPVWPANHDPFHCWRADHVYKPEYYDSSKRLLDFGTANACHLNANCPLGDGWEDQKRGTARIIVVVAEGAGYCSGNLINNTAANGRPYLLTGLHCQAGFTPLYDLWRFDFGFRAPACATPNNAPTFTSYSGALFRASWEASDFLLLELTDPTFNAVNHFFAGWDRSDGPVSGATIAFHHPMGDLQKLGFSPNSATIINNSITWNNNASYPCGPPLFDELLSWNF
ncbi:MAG: hypothetical protein HC821_01850 [Lewinella sp.]|nr:hypothetical protein [Lewinella sp.]